MKKILSVVLVALLFAVLQMPLFAAVLEINTDSPEFKADTWQNNTSNETSNEVCPLINALETTATTTNAGVDGMEIKRYTASLQAGTANIEGAVVFVNGSATSNVVFPLKEAATLDSLSLKFNNGERQFFFNVYTSMDGTNWNEISISSGAKKVTLDNSYDENGETNGPGGIQCYASVPAGIADNNDIAIATFKFADSAETKYVKMTLYGNDGASGTNTIGNPWWSFNSLKIEGDIVTARVEEVVEATVDPVPAGTPVQTTVVKAPQTNDLGTYIFIGLTIICGTGIIMIRKKCS